RRFACTQPITAFDPCRVDPFETDSRGREAPHIDPAEIAGGKRKKNSASVALRAWSFMGRSRFVFDAGEPRPHGCANPPRLERSWEARRASDDTGAKHSRTLSHERDARLTWWRTR